VLKSPGKLWPNHDMPSHPTKIGKYNVEGILGRGGMGVVYKAVDAQIGRYVAIKMITAGGDPSLLERFKSEARSTGSLQCPNIVTVYDFGEQDGNPYLVMQYLEGSSLESMIQKGVPLTLSEKLGIIIDVCNGLAYAHQRGVIHRDIKPGNIMVLQDGENDGMAIIVDFGIARIGGDTRITRTDQIIGSVHYMSAEQLQAKELDNRTDVYATGVVLFQLLTGALPFDSPDTASTLLKIVNEQPPPLSTYLKDYPVELEEIASHALAKKREERYASAKDLAFDLTQVQDRLKSETVAQLLRRAETSLQREDFTRAREHLQQAQRIDRQNTKVQKMLSAVHERLRQLQQIEQARALRGQADEAYLDQRYDDALRLLEQAVALDGNNSDLQVFRESLRSAKERAVGLRRALRRAEAALQDGDLDEAQNAVSEAFKIDPQDTQANALKVVIAQHAEEKLRHEKVRKLLDEARNQITYRNLTAAFNILKNVETLDPTSNELQTVRKLALAAREQEKRRIETEAFRRQIEAALREEDFATAVARADEGLLKFPQEQSLLKLKALADAQRARAGQKKFVREQFSAATSLADSGHLCEAVTFLDRALQNLANPELESLRATILDRLASEDSEKRRQDAAKRVFAEAERILRERGAREAIRYLESKSEYSDSQPFRELYDSIRKREAFETLNTGIAKEWNPAEQLELAEEALRKNQDNEWIQQTVADLRRIRDQIDAAIKQAKSVEAAGLLAEAAQQWQQLAGTYPRVTEFAVQIGRIARELEARNKKEDAVVESHSPENAIDSLSATRVLDSAVPPGVGPLEAGAPSDGPESVVSHSRYIDLGTDQIAVHERPAQQTLDKTNLFAGSKKYFLLVSVLLVIAVVGYFIFGKGKKINSTQKETVARGTSSFPVIDPVSNPPKIPDRGTLIVHANVDAADVFISGNFVGATGRDKEFEAPLAVGAYDINVRKSGYDEQPSQHVQITKDLSNSVSFILRPSDSLIRQTQNTYLIVASKPGAVVGIDHHPVGTIPVTGTFVANVDPRPHDVEVDLPGYKSFSRSVVPKNGDRLRVDADLAEIRNNDQYLIVQGPAGAGVAVDQHPAESISASGRLSVTVIPGTHNIEVKKEGYAVWQRKVQVPLQPGSSLSVVAELEPINKSTASTEMHTPIALSPTTSLVVIPESIEKGQSAELRWEAKNATEVTIDGEKVPLQGTMKVSPSDSKKYRLIARGAGGEARDVTQLEVKTTTFPASGELAEQSIQRLLDLYVAAFQSKDRDLLRHIWPTVSDKDFKNTQGAFKDADSIHLRLRKTGPVQVTGDTGVVTCVHDAEIGVGGRVQPLSYEATFHLRRLQTGGNGEWIIERIDFKKH
jgi:serine/threonine protein kinase